MSRSIISTEKAAPAIGPYSQAVRVQGPLLYTSGQIPLQPTGDLVTGGITEQAHAVMANLKAILEEAGTDFGSVVKTTVFLKNMNDFTTLNEVYKQYFTGDAPPARSTVQVARLPKDALVEIEVVALLKA